MSWFLEEKILESLWAEKLRQEWAESEAYSQFHEIKESLKKEMQDPARIGAFGVKSIAGAHGLQPWLFPIEGHPKILGARNIVNLLEKSGAVFFEGLWGDVTLPMVQDRAEFFIFLPYRAGKEPIKPDWMTRLKGLFRYLRYRKR